MMLLRRFVTLGSLFLGAWFAHGASSQLYLANLQATASNTNNAGKLVSFPFSAKNLVGACQEALAASSSKGLLLGYQAGDGTLNVVDATNKSTRCFFLQFVDAGEAITSLDGTQQRRLMNIQLFDRTVVGTAVFTEKFTYTGQLRTGYTLQATLQILLPAAEAHFLGLDRTTVISGRLLAVKKL